MRTFVAIEVNNNNVLDSIQQIQSKLNIKAKWIVKSFESECVSNLFSKDGKNRYFAYNKLIDQFGYTKEQITDLMEELKQ